MSDQSVEKYAGFSLELEPEGRFYVAVLDPEGYLPNELDAGKNRFAELELQNRILSHQPHTEDAVEIIRGTLSPDDLPEGVSMEQHLDNIRDIRAQELEVLRRAYPVLVAKNDALYQAQNTESSEYGGDLSPDELERIENEAAQQDSTGAGGGAKGVLLHPFPEI